MHQLGMFCRISLPEFKAGGRSAARVPGGCCGREQNSIVSKRSDHLAAPARHRSGERQPVSPHRSTGSAVSAPWSLNASRIAFRRQAARSTSKPIGPTRVPPSSHVSASARSRNASCTCSLAVWWVAMGGGDVLRPTADPPVLAAPRSCGAMPLSPIQPGRRAQTRPPRKLCRNSSRPLGCRGSGRHCHERIEPVA